jgi:hypothetical protein
MNYHTTFAFRRKMTAPGHNSKIPKLHAAAEHLSGDLCCLSPGSN